MSRDDWFRGAAWDSRTRETVEDKLKRARSGRAQYLRITGLGLTESSKPEIRRAGRDLLRRVLDEHADDRLQVAMARADLGDAFARDGHFDEAAEHYQQAMDSPSNVESYARNAASPTPSSIRWT